ncbi:hypothetical protein KGA66_27605 [Actinocrinis puniceicyclus]|uniref:Uncharacterized protein n=1 Tax=Actinocrinis puniceicyclus TaxID=977794 RepID=A0A8J8BE23_9ACTN|nr:hypothetical protein [Actinocrinis puniceicyclus]MBS2966832.1 hypothetical protein [Actinocrinis puniceicyclus]
MSGRIDPGLAFWLRYVTARGGLAEADGETYLAVLPEPVREESGFDELVHVTGDPDIAREGAAVLLGPGHPALTAAADRVLAAGDVGVLALDDTRRRPPDAETLLERARDQFPIDHGRIFATGSPTPSFRTVLRIGALVTYTLSADEHYQEQVEYWIDVDSRLPLSAVAAQRLTTGQPLPSGGGSGLALGPGQLAAALAAARELIDQAALRRRAELSAAARKACAEETQRAEDYYAAQLMTLRQRADAVAEEKTAAYLARIEATEAERERRLAEIGEKYAPGHDVRPFRAIAVRVPAVRLPAEARRGDRRHALRLDYLTAAGEYAGLRCPSCSSTAPLVLAKTGFGCESCLKPPPATPGATAPTTNANANTSTSTSTLPAQRAAPRSPAPKPARPVPSAAQPAQSARKSAPTVPPKAAPTAKPPRTRSADAGTTTRHRRSADPNQTSFKLWQAVSDGDRKTVESLCEPHSPAAAAVRLYGPGGLLVCLELSPGDRPTGVSGAPYNTWRGRRAFAGALETRAGGREFLLTWANDEPLRVIELMPFADIYRLGMLRFAGPGQADRTPPKPSLVLDPVAEQLWKVVPRTHGLQLTLRALCSLWRLEDLDEHLTRHDPRVLAASLHRLAGYWSQAAGTTYAEAAVRYGVAEPDIRAASTALQKKLKLTRERPW